MKKHVDYLDTNAISTQRVLVVFQFETLLVSWVGCDPLLKTLDGKMAAVI